MRSIWVFKKSYCNHNYAYITCAPLNIRKDIAYFTPYTMTILLSADLLMISKSLWRRVVRRGIHLGNIGPSCLVCHGDAQSAKERIKFMKVMYCNCPD